MKLALPVLYTVGSKVSNSDGVVVKHLVSKINPILSFGVSCTRLID